MPLDSSQDYYHSMILGADYKDLKENITLTGTNGLETPISYSSFSTEYQATHLAGDSLTGFSAGFHFGVRGLGNSEKEFEEKRYKARPNFLYLLAKLNNDYKFNDGYLLRSIIEAQLADQPLVSNEQFSAGGAESVRGYHESQVLGDNAVRGSLELHLPDFPWADKYGLRDFFGLVFIDGAILTIHDPLPDEEDNFDIYGTGFGVRMTGPGGFASAIDVAWALRGIDDIHSGDVRVHFRFNYGF
jgi:hemolysin activation/secretion protein